MRKTKRITYDRNLPPSSVPSVSGLAAHLTKLSPTLLDDGIETSGTGLTRRNTRASMLLRRKKHWRKMRTVVGKEGPLEMRHTRLRDRHARATMRFRWAQYMTEGPLAVELTPHERTRYMQMQAHAMQAMMEEKPKKKAETLQLKAVKEAEDFKTLMMFLWRAGAMDKTRSGLLSEFAYKRFNYLLHYALLPNLMDADEAFARAGKG